MDTLFRRLPALLLILLVGLVPAAGALQPATRAASPTDASSRDARPLEGAPTLRAAIVTSDEVRLEHRSDGTPSTSVSRSLPEPTGSAAGLEPRIRRSAPPPIFLIHCSFLC